jgi:uncharacterized protein (DUF362 family)
MERRSFIRLLAIAAFFSPRMVAKLGAKELPVVGVATGTDYGAITRNAITAVGGMKRFVKTGDVVVVKPNMGWDRTPEQAANTNPQVVKAVVEEALKAGARKVKVFDRTCNDERRCYANSGIQAALKGIPNVEVHFIENERFKMVALNGGVLKEWELYGEVLSANVFINVPVAKHHKLTGLTLGLKNVMGVMGGDRGKLHKQIEPALADVNAILKSHLTVIDATRILTDHGPQGGDLADVKVMNTVIASTDIVAADAYATTLFGKKPSDIGVTVAAAKRGIGEMDLKKVRIVKV